jgi:VWFA-related protein
MGSSVNGTTEALDCMRAGVDAKAAAFVTVLCLAVMCAAEDKQSDYAPKTPVFHSKTELVLVPVVVKGKGGRHLGGLKQDAFAVRQDGKEQKIAVFEEISTGVQPAKRPKLPPDMVSNTFADAQDRRVIIIALDTINTAFLDQTRAREELVKFLSEQLDADTLVSLVTINRGGVTVIHDFTTDPRILMAALRKVRGGISMAEGQSVLPDPLEEDLRADPNFNSEVSGLGAFMHSQSQAQRLDWRLRTLSTLDAFTTLAQEFAGVPGRKALLWATGSFPFTFVDPNEAQNGTSFADFLPEYEHAWQLLNTANIAVYPVDVRGLVNPSFISPSTRRVSQNTTQTAGRQHMETISAMDAVAQMTGGRAFYNTNDLAKSFRLATQDSEAYYLLGYYRDSADAKPGWRKLKVEVHAEHAQVRARSGFYVAKAAKNPEDTRKADMRSALVSPVEFTGVPMMLHWTDRSSAPRASTPNASTAAKRKVPFELILPVSAVEIDRDDTNHMTLEVFGIVRDITGKEVDNIGETVQAHLKPENLKKVAESGVTYRSVFELAPGDYTARLIVRDGISGRIGSIITPLKVQ